MFKKIIVSICLSSAALLAQATTVNYTGTTKSVGNCIPFGCPDLYGPHMGFIYKDIAAFTLNPGDIIAFDTGAKNDKELRFDLSLAETAVNGGNTANGAGFTRVSSLGSGFFGDNIVGNYDIAFIVNAKFSFAGGGLITDFLNTNGAVIDNTGEQNLVYSSNSPYNVARYYAGATAGSISSGTSANAIGTFSIITHEVPEPSALFLLGLGVASMALVRRHARR